MKKETALINPTQERRTYIMVVEVLNQPRIILAAQLEIPNIVLQKDIVLIKK